MTTADQAPTADPGAQIDGDERTAGVDTETTGEQQNGSQADKGLREARDRYRGERDSARDELAAAQARIEAMQTREVERLAGAHLAQPGDLLTLSGKTLADFLDDNGDVGAELVSEAAADVLAARPGLRPNARAVDPSQGIGNDRPARPKPSFVDLFRN